MQRWYSNKVFSVFLISILILSAGFLLVYGLRSRYGNHIKVDKNISFSRMGVSEDVSSYVKYRIFQNSDSTWGFTVFVNGRPYIHQKRIPLNSAITGFRSKRGAEKVADIFVKMIRNGNLNPQLNKNMLDSLGT
jgi:hypothetical protein